MLKFNRLSCESEDITQHNTTYYMYHSANPPAKVHRIAKVNDADAYNSFQLIIL